MHISTETIVLLLSIDAVVLTIRDLILKWRFQEDHELLDRVANIVYRDWQN